MDHYQTLGIDKNATPDDIKKAYRKLASTHHPDKGGDTAMFQNIQSAYDVLSDPEKRKQYDNPAPQFNGFQQHPGGFSFSANGVDINDIFAQMFGQHFGQTQHRSRAAPVYRTQVWTTLEQIYKGEEQQLKLQTPTESKMVTITIPKGINEGDQIRYDNVISNANLIVEFRVHPHLKFERRGSDLYCNQSISVLDLIVGTTIEFTGISGKIFEVKVPPKTQPHIQLKISGQGMPILNSSKYGDQIILLKPYIPDNIDPEITNSILRSKNL